MKFRVWDSLKKEMIVIQNGYFISFCTGKSNYWWVGHEDDNDNLLVDSITGDGKESQDALMQYTGLKDKNGTEIYEGDVCLFKNVLRGTDKIKAISFSVNDGCWMWGNVWFNYPGIVMNLEIIGNIYENPELLEATK